MSAQGTIKRYTLLIEKINSKHFPSFSILKDFLEDHGFNISPRTLQRDIEQIRNEFGIEIVYNRTKNGYFIDEDNSINLDSFIKFLEIASTGEILADSIREGKEVLDFISFESEGSLKGIENLKALVLATRNKRKVEFVHENYDFGTKKKYIVCPYHIKEYQNRWYVFGTIEGDNFRTFGIDRISELKVLTQAFKPIKTDAVEAFEDVIGLTYSQSKVEEVHIWLNPRQAKYANALPLHQSQKIVKEDKAGTVISLKVRLNYELVQKILLLGPNGKVLKPEKLVNEVKTTLSDMLNLYMKGANRNGAEAC